MKYSHSGGISDWNEALADRNVEILKSDGRVHIFHETLLLAC